MALRHLGLVALPAGLRPAVLLAHPTVSVLSIHFLTMNTSPLRLLGFSLALFLTTVACQKLLPGAPEDDSLLDGPIEGLTPGQNAQFLAGDIAFNDEIFTPATGLGPYFVSSSCGSCHAGDGKGHPFTTLTRFGQVDETGNTFMEQGGPQLQNRAIPGHAPEAIPAGASFSKFTPPARRCRRATTRTPPAPRSTKTATAFRAYPTGFTHRTSSKRSGFTSPKTGCSSGVSAKKPPPSICCSKR